MDTVGKNMRSSIATVLILLCFFSSLAKADPARLKRLTDLWMDIHKGFAFSTHCHQTEVNPPPILLFYSLEAGAVKKDLEAEMQIEHPEMDGSKAFYSVYQMGNNKKNELDKFYETADSCKSETALQGKNMLYESNTFTTEQATELQQHPEKVIEILDQLRAHPNPPGSSVMDQMMQSAKGRGQ